MLGAVRVWRQEHELTLGHPRQRALLAMLAVRASRPVGRDELIDGIWGSDPPATAANCVHSYVARLRLVLEPGRAARAPSSVLASAGPGYALRLRPRVGGTHAFPPPPVRGRPLPAAGDAPRAGL